jgi:hypothetical protein
MKQLDLARFEVNRDYSVWPIDFAISASFEMPAPSLQAALPPGVHLLEPRPGLALLNLAVFHFTADTFGLAEACSELVVSAHVMPNLSFAPMLPRMSMFTFRIGATSRGFIDSPFATDHYPVFPDPLDIRIDRERIAVDVMDAAGRPILHLAAAEGVSPPYEDDRFYVQSMTAKDGQLYRSGNLFEFRRAENQRNLKTGGRPSPHALFDGLDVSAVTADHCHFQMWSQPGSLGRENHFFLQRAAQR